MGKVAYRMAVEKDASPIYVALLANDNEQNLTERFYLSENQLHTALFSKESFAEVLIGEVDNNLAAFILFSPTNRNFNLFKTPGLYIHTIYVKPEFRRQAVGTELMDKIIAIAKARNCCRIDWVLLKENGLGKKFFDTISPAKTVDYIDYKRISL